MIKVMYKTFFYFCIFYLTSAKASTYTTQNYDHSSFLEILGNPYKAIYSKTEERYARNIWDISASYEVFSVMDDEFQKAMEVLNDNALFKEWKIQY